MYPQNTPIQECVLTWGPVFQVEGSRLEACEQGEHSDTGHSHSSEATTSSVFPKAKTHFMLSNWN